VYQCSGSVCYTSQVPSVLGRFTNKGHGLRNGTRNLTEIGSNVIYFQHLQAQTPVRAKLFRPRVRLRGR